VARPWSSSIRCFHLTQDRFGLALYLEPGYGTIHKTGGERSMSRAGSKLILEKHWFEDSPGRDVQLHGRAGVGEGRRESSYGRIFRWNGARAFLRIASTERRPGNAACILIRRRRLEQVEFRLRVRRAEYPLWTWPLVGDARRAAAGSMAGRHTRKGGLQLDEHEGLKCGLSGI